MLIAQIAKSSARNQVLDGGSGEQALCECQRDWPEELAGRHNDLFVRAQRGESRAND